MLLMVLATRLLTYTCRWSPAARKACAPLPVAILPTSSGALPPATSYTSTPVPPVRPSSRWRPSGVPKMSAGSLPVGVRYVSVWLARSMVTSSSLSCMLDQTVVLCASIHKWLGVRPVAMRLTRVGSWPSQR